MSLIEELVGNGGMVGLLYRQLIGKLTPEKQKIVAAGLKAWLLDVARKSVRPDLPVLIHEFGKRIDLMVADMDIEVVDNKPVVKVVGSSRDTLLALERGTNWFDPCEDVVSIVISSLWRS